MIKIETFIQDYLLNGQGNENESFHEILEFQQFEYKGTIQEKEQAFILKVQYDWILQIFSDEFALDSSFDPAATTLFFKQLLIIRNPDLRRRFLNRLPLFLINLKDHASDLNLERFGYKGVPLLPLYADLLLCFEKPEAEAIYSLCYQQRKSLKDKKKQLAFLNLVENLIFSVNDTALKKAIIEHVLKQAESIEERARQWTLLVSNQKFNEEVFLSQIKTINLEDQDWNAVLASQNRENLKDILEQVNLSETQVFLSSKEIDLLEALFKKSQTYASRWPDSDQKEYTQKLEELVKAILKDRYHKERYKNLRGLSEAQKESWMEDLREESDLYIGRETDDPWEMLSATNDVNSACMSIYAFYHAGKEGPAVFFKNAHYRLITIKTWEGTPIAISYIYVHPESCTVTYQLYDSNLVSSEKIKEADELFKTILEKKDKL